MVLVVVAVAVELDQVCVFRPHPCPSYEAYHRQADFVYQVVPGRFCRRLSQALVGRFALCPFALCRFVTVNPAGHS